MKLSLSTPELELREEVRSFLAHEAPAPADVPSDFDLRMDFLRSWQRKLHDARLVALSWPEEHGGRGATLMEQIVVDQEMASLGAPEIIGSIGLSVVGPSIIEHGTAEQLDRYLEPILSAEDIWCQGFSEPNAGSDLASLRTVAEDRGDHFVVRGQKTWTSYATFATKCAVLAITDPDAPAHRGISYLLVDLRSEGVHVSPLVQTTGDHEFGEVFFDDVRVPKTDVLGPLNGGWRIAMHTLSHERGPYAMTRQVLLRIALDRAVDTARRMPRAGGRAIDDPSILSTLASAHIETEVLRYQCYRSVGRQVHGGEPGPESSVDKVLLGRAEQRIAAASLDVLGAYAGLTDGSPWDAEAAEMHRFYLFGRAGSVYGGSEQIQKNIIAERVLGLPRSL
jgi:alkylation response protein AidB-like acyl-CoA dehydrogenase